MRTNNFKTNSLCSHLKTLSYAKKDKLAIDGRKTAAEAWEHLFVRENYCL